MVEWKNLKNIVDVIEDLLNPTQLFSGKKVLITAGPTYESIDPVRYIGNHSSGKMGFEIAKAFLKLGAEVELVTGPVSIEIVDPNINVSRVTSAKEMYEACNGYYKESDIVIMAAAIADFVPKIVSEKKIKKEDGYVSIELEPTIDILATLGKSKREDQIFSWVCT